MKKLAAFLTIAFLTSLSVRADVIFQDLLNYPDGLFEGDGLWQVYSPAPPIAPYGDAFITNDLLILNENNNDCVEAPFTNDLASSVIFASFTINVTTLPSVNGGYFCEFQDAGNSNEVAHVFIATTGTSVPGTYRLGINNYIASSSITAKAKFYPLDLSTNITYYVVFSYDTVQTDPYPGATLVVNPATVADYDASPAFGTDNSPTPGQETITNSQIGFSQYDNQGVAGIGDVFVGTSFGDVFTNTPQIPVIGIQPQDGSVYSGNSLTLYTAASGLGQLTYQWLSNTVPLSDDGITVIGSASNILVLSNLQNTASYGVIVGNTAGTTNSMAALVTVTNTPTEPFFITQPVGVTNGIGATITLTALANGTGPLTYQWFFEETNLSTYVSVGTGPTLTLANVNFNQSGSYYVTATGGDGSQNSATVNVQVIPPPLVTLGYMHSLLIPNAPNGTLNINNGAIYTVQGVVTTVGQIGSKTYSEYFIQDATGGALVFVNPATSNTPPVGSLVTVTGPAQQYYGELEMVPNVTNGSSTVGIISSGNPVPAPVPLNLPLMAATPMSAYGLGIQCSLVTLTNVWLYSSSKGAAVSGTYPNNSTKALYAFNQPYSAGQPYMEVYVYTYTNASSLNTNYFGKAIPSFAYEITGAMALYNPTSPEIYPSRYQDIVTNPPASFPLSLSYTNGVSTLSWPAVVGSTYSVYSTTDAASPWTRTFGLSYYPSSGVYTTTNSAASQLYYVTSP
ncbi:MAG: immunoglobulin domain-containing protein [Verrucomicrobiota bacterium]